MTQARTVVRGSTVLVALAAVVAVGLRAVPAAAGALLLAYGAWLAWPPAGFLTVGALLILADRRIP